MIAEENKRLSILVENVLRSAMLDQSDFRLRNDSLDMHDLIQRVLKSFQVHFERRKVNLKIELNATNVKLTGDQVHLTNAVFNLIDNALKYTPEGPEILIKTYNQQHYFCFHNHQLLPIREKYHPVYQQVLTNLNEYNKAQ
jgi:two-component system phosphate regulon sensor histidine kinase PhoR